MSNHTAMCKAKYEVKTKTHTDYQNPPCCALSSGEGGGEGGMYSTHDDAPYSLTCWSLYPHNAEMEQRFICRVFVGSRRRVARIIPAAIITTPCVASSTQKPVTGYATGRQPLKQPRENTCTCPEPTGGTQISPPQPMHLQQRKCARELRLPAAVITPVLHIAGGYARLLYPYSS